MSACRVIFDSSRCSSIGLCEAALPDVFRIDDDGLTRLLESEVPIERAHEVEQAVLNCPTRSLSFEIVD